MLCLLLLFVIVVVMGWTQSSLMVSECMTVISEGDVVGGEMVGGEVERMDVCDDEEDDEQLLTLASEEALFPTPGLSLLLLTLLRPPLMLSSLRALEKEAHRVDSKLRDSVVQRNTTNG